MADEVFDIVLTSNSPGEISSFVKPAAAAIKKTIPDSRIILVITPCQYSSGREIEVARSFEDIYEIIFPQEFKDWVFKKRPPKGISFSKKGAVLFLGGDLLHAVILSKKLGYKAFAYSMNHFAWKNAFLKFFVPDEKMAKKARKHISSHKIKITGDLMMDSVETKLTINDFPLEKDKPVITFLPGSRPAHIRFFVPFFIKTAEYIKKSLPEAQFVFSVSPYSNSLVIEESASAKNKFGDFGSGAALKMIDGVKYLETEDGLRILLIEKMPYDAMNIADLIVTMPGTNTAEAASLGKPMLVVVPFNRPEAFIFDGLLGIIGNAPVIGKYIKKSALLFLNKIVKFTALPNMKAGKFIVPEMRGTLKAEDVAVKAVEMMSNKEMLEKMSEELKKAMGEKGAALKIAEEIKNLLLHK